MFTAPPLFDTATLSSPDMEVAGIGYRLLVSSEQTGGAYELMYFEMPPGFTSPLHVHRNEEECTMTLEGHLEGTVGDRTVQVPAGTVLHLPRGVPHRCRNVGPGTAKFLIWVTPGNLAGFYEACKQPRAAEVRTRIDTSVETDSSTAAPTPVALELGAGGLAAVAAHYGIDILPA